ncbi:MAG TPA: ABC transporter permease [Solirubrobacterales bacterium]|nr:ABC transporter permease [Solirubrobacterales bacterium]
MPDEPSAERGPWSLALRRFLRNRLAVAFLGLFVLIVLFVLAAPLWAEHVAETGPNTQHIVEQLTVDGEKRDVVSVEGKPIGPQWFDAGGKFFLGADSRLGRDEMVRLMYGGRTSLLVGITAALISTLLAVVLGLLAGYFGGRVDAVIARVLDTIWSLPVFLIGLSIGIALAVGGLALGPLELSGGSLLIPIGIISIFTVPYIARPVRGQVLALSRKEFVEAAVAQGAGPVRVMFREILPNLASTIIVFFTLMIATAMLFEAGLSFLGAGVQPPNSSWGTMISVGVELLRVQPLLAILPGAMIMLTVLSLNIIGDALRDALDPRGKQQMDAALQFEAQAGVTKAEGGAALP